MGRLEHSASDVRGSLLCVALLVTAGCGVSRYDRRACPGDAFPEAAELLRRPAFGKLDYFRGTTNYRRRVDYETWADRQFEFTTTLSYHYSKDDAQSCARGVVLLVKHPPDPEGEALGREFIAFFEQEWRREMSQLRSVYGAYARQREGPFPIYREELDGLVAEVSIAHNVVRGDSLSVALYERSFYRSTFPEPRGPDGATPSPNPVVGALGTPVRDRLHSGGRSGAEPARR